MPHDHDAAFWSKILFFGGKPFFITDLACAGYKKPHGPKRSIDKERRTFEQTISTELACVNPSSKKPREPDEKKHWQWTVDIWANSFNWGSRHKPNPSPKKPHGPEERSIDKERWTFEQTISTELAGVNPILLQRSLIRKEALTRACCFLPNGTLLEEARTAVRSCLVFRNQIAGQACEGEC